MRRYREAVAALQPLTTLLFLVRPSPPAQREHVGYKYAAMPPRAPQFDRPLLSDQLVPFGRAAVYSEERRLIVAEQPPMNAYQRAQLEKRMKEQRHWLAESTRHSARLLQQDDETRARETLLPRRQPSPPFKLQPPPHLALLAVPQHHSQTAHRYARPPVPAYSSAPPTRPYGPVFILPPDRA